MLANATLCRFQPTLPARGATPATAPRLFYPFISTHAPRTGSDFRADRLASALIHFNPRSPHGERPQFAPPYQTGHRFQPTLPARGATFPCFCIPKLTMQISTHAPRTGSDDFHGLAGVHFVAISTHAPRTGSDHEFPGALLADAEFQPTLPARGATGHLLRRDAEHLFQPTLPARGATFAICYLHQPPLISTHAPRTGSDVL